MTAKPYRAPRCLRLVAPSNGIKIKPAIQCANERIPGSDLCGRHIADAVIDLREFTTQAPGMERCAELLAEADAEFRRITGLETS